jgi:hypothetical protein
MKRINITALDAEGNAIYDYKTTSKWCLSELDSQMAWLKPALYDGEIDNILIGIERD